MFLDVLYYLISSLNFTSIGINMKALSCFLGGRLNMAGIQVQILSAVRFSTSSDLSLEITIAGGV